MDISEGGISMLFPNLIKINTLRIFLNILLISFPKKPWESNHLSCRLEISPMHQTSLRQRTTTLLLVIQGFPAGLAERSKKPEENRKK